MATYNKFQDYVEQKDKGVHNIGTDVYKLALTNVLPVNTQVSFDPVTDHDEPANVAGYTANGEIVTLSVAEAAGISTVQGTQAVYTASGGQIGPFQYAVLYNDSATSPADALVAWWDYGSSITLNDGESFTAKFNNASPGDIHTLT